MEDFEIKEVIEELEFIKDRFYDFPEETGISNDIKNIQNAIKAIKKIEEYKSLEEQGKLLKLPCAVGDTVYIVRQGEVLSLKVLEFQIFLLEGELVMQIKCTDAVSYGYMHFLTKEIGETIFRTPEEAEAALKELDLEL